MAQSDPRLIDMSVPDLQSALTAIGGTLVVSGGTIVSSNVSNTQYTEGDTDATITGTVIM